MSGSDVQRSMASCADEVIEDHWPTSSESEAEDFAHKMMDLASELDDKSNTAGQGRDYAESDMEGQAAEAISQKYGIHVAELADHALGHRYTAGWLTVLSGGIVAAKRAINEAIELHEADHLAPLAKSHFEIAKNPGSRTQAQKDATLQAARAAVEEAATGLESLTNSVLAGIRTGQRPPMLPQPRSAGQTGTHEREEGSRRAGLSGPDPTAATPSPGLTSPGLTDPGLTSPGLTDPGLTSPALTSPGGSSTGATGASAPVTTPEATPAASVPTPRLTPDMAASASDSAGLGSGSPMSGMPMGGMPMGGMPMQPPQMPQMGQTPGADIAKTAGDTIGKLAGGQGQGGQPLDSSTLDKLLDANLGSNDSGLGDSDGVVFKDDKLDKVFGNGLGNQLNGHGGLTSPYSAANTNPALNNPAPTLVGPSPAAPTITPTPPVSHAPMTELSADEAPATPAPGPAPHPEPAGAHPATAAAGGGGQPGQQQPALGAYSGGGLMPPPPMMGGGAAAMPAAPSAAIPAVTVGGVAAAAAPILVPTGSNSSTPAAADPAAALNAGPERATLTPEQAVAHEHLAGILKAFHARPGMPWFTVNLAIGVFHHEEGTRSRVRYIVATSDGVSLIPLDVQLPAGVELLSAVDLSPAFIADWIGHERPALKLVAAADSYPDLVGQLNYLVSSEEAANTSGSLARAAHVTEVVQTGAETESLIATHRASSTTRSRVMADWPRVPAEKATEALEAFGKWWHVRVPETVPPAAEQLDMSATQLWAARWGNRRIECPEDYPYALAEYWYHDGQIAASQGRLDEAAYAATQLALIDSR